MNVDREHKNTCIFFGKLAYIKSRTTKSGTSSATAMLGRAIGKDNVTGEWKYLNVPLRAYGTTADTLLSLNNKDSVVVKTFYAPYEKNTTPKTIVPQFIIMEFLQVERAEGEPVDTNDSDEEYDDDVPY